MAVIPLVAFLVSVLTFFSGFGLGTMLMPVFAIWFPIDLAVALTAIVHFLNNVFKLLMIGKNADRRVVLRFGVPAIVSALLGAWVLVHVSGFAPLFRYTLFGRTFQVLPVKLTIATLMIVFTGFEVFPRLKNWQIDPRYLPLGGILSGFFGGLSGHQGALRSMFLIRSGLEKESFIATGIVIACLIDTARLGVYSRHFAQEGITQNAWLLARATLAAFLGAYLGNKLLKKVTMEAIQRIVSGCLFLLAVALGIGLI